MTALLAPVRGKIRIDRYEMLNAKVQRHGDLAVLTYNIVNYRRQPDGTEMPTTRWNSTAVFHRAGGRWRTIHSHFSYTKPELK
jgi:ketosteroid isomerase-like protein